MTNNKKELKNHDEDMHSAITDEMRIVEIRDERQSSVSMGYELWIGFRDELYRVLSRADGYYVHHVMPDEEVSVGIDNARDAVQLIIGDEEDRDESERDGSDNGSNPGDDL